MGRRKWSPENRRLAARRVNSRKATGDEFATGNELMQALLSIRGLHIDDVFPPSDREPSFMACHRVRAGRPPARGNSTRGEGKRTMGAKGRAAAGRRATASAAHDEAAIREELLQALLSIRGMDIEDVYPPSDRAGDPK